MTVPSGLRLALGAALLLAAPGLLAPVRADSRSNYLLHCGGCHLADGRGLPPSIPSLVGSLGYLAGIPEGRDYIARVPGAAQSPLSDEELAAVLNWVLWEFNATTLPEAFQPLDGAEVGASRSRVLADPLKRRHEIWPQPGS